MSMAKSTFCCSNGLTAHDGDNQVVPGLAES